MKVVDLDNAFDQVVEPWRPKIIAELNGQEVKAAKLDGAFVWHRHDVDEMFLVWRGRVVIETREESFSLGPGQIMVVPRGVEHRPIAEVGAEVLLFEPSGVVNTGDAPRSEFTAPIDRL